MYTTDIGRKSWVDRSRNRGKGPPSGFSGVFESDRDDTVANILKNNFVKLGVDPLTHELEEKINILMSIESLFKRMTLLNAEEKSHVKNIPHTPMSASIVSTLSSLQSWWDRIRRMTQNNSFKQMQQLFLSLPDDISRFLTAHNLSLSPDEAELGSGTLMDLPGNFFRTAITIAKELELWNKNSSVRIDQTKIYFNSLDDDGRSRLLLLIYVLSFLQFSRYTFRQCGYDIEVPNWTVAYQSA